tara:strand:- start:601 stop:798 length:198 start_codon:yes stop_codon:yes gene_type:complete
MPGHGLDVAWASKVYLAVNVTINNVHVIGYVGEITAATFWAMRDSLCVDIESDVGEFPGNAYPIV